MGLIRTVQTSNAGAVLFLGGLTVWADVLNEENPDGYEVLSEAHFHYLLDDPAFRPDLILFTHRHPDHYSESRLQKAVSVYPDAQVYVGGGLLGQPSEMVCGDLKVRAIPLPHEGKAYEGEENDALLLTCPEGNVLIPGDCPVGCPQLFESLEKHAFSGRKAGNSEIGLALLNFPWLSLGKGRKALLRLLAQHVLFFHLPSPEADVYGYREQAERMLERYKEDRDWRIAGRPFSEERFLI